MPKKTAAPTQPNTTRSSMKVLWKLKPPRAAMPANCHRPSASVFPCSQKAE